MSIQDSSFPAQDSASSVSAAQAAVARQQYGSRRRWFVADDLHLCICGASENGKSETVEAVGETNTEADEQIALFQDAIALAEHEPLLTCIDHWCAAALDWQPLPVAEQVPPSPGSVVEALTDADVDVTLSALNGPERSVELALTAQRLASMPEFPPELSDMAVLSWRQVSVVLCIDRFILSNDDIERLGPGALIVLPASFNEVWLGNIREVIPDGEPAGVRIDAATGELLRLSDKKQLDDWQSASSSADTSTSQSPTLNVMLADPITVDVRQWRAASPALPGLTTSGPLCGRRVSLQLATGTSVADKFTGEIVSLGTGYAVRLSTTIDCA